MERFFTRFSTITATAAGQPISFVAAVGLIALWIVTGPLFHWSDTWQLVVNTATTIVTFLMVFLIQNSQNRDAAALQAKLDEMIRADRRARNEFIGIEHLTDHEIESIRLRLEREVSVPCGEAHSQEAVERMLARR
ncbi:low affinity iron permease family protein [Sphingomonas piscis]|uniref:Low affinity iron permease family protein n=1 Tax=Sphingomonas piscis TaxID=2714943 RepID=A0A6G7YPK3_9SPHN|nr:low affinity iron permease family protein [Sphingomonas piscis]QIK78669.1 low affinity iron permease family protein [Sphingomonas piscis]